MLFNSPAIVVVFLLTTAQVLAHAPTKSTCSCPCAITCNLPSGTPFRPIPEGGENVCRTPPASSRAVFSYPAATVGEVAIAALQQRIVVNWPCRKVGSTCRTPVGHHLRDFVNTLGGDFGMTVENIKNVCTLMYVATTPPYSRYWCGGTKLESVVGRALITCL